MIDKETRFIIHFNHFSSSASCEQEQEEEEEEGR